MPEAEHFTLRSYSAHNTRGYFNLGKKRANIIAKKAEEDLPGFERRFTTSGCAGMAMAGCRRGEWPRRKTSRCRIDRQETRRERKRDSVQFDSLFLFFFAAISSDQLSSILRMTIAATTTMSASLLLLNSLMSPESGPLLELQCGGD